MINQASITIATTIRVDRLEPLRAAMKLIDAQVRANGGVFKRINDELLHVHFGRWVILEAKRDLDQNVLPPQLIYLCDIDLLDQDHLQLLVKNRFDTIDGHPVDILDLLYANCEGYPHQPSDADRLSYLGSHRIVAQTIYVNKIGRTVKQVLREQELRTAIEEILDGKDWQGMTSVAVRQAIQKAVRQRPNLSWALQPEPSPLEESLFGSLKSVLRTGFEKVIDGLNVLGKLTVIPLLPNSTEAGLERTGIEDIKPVKPEVIEELEEFDDRGAVQSPFSAIGLVKKGFINHAAEQVKLFAANIGARNLFGDSDLSGVKTIHFARWIFMDGGRRVLFCSNYDGSLENYMSDFVDLVAWGLNVVFGQGEGYPRTVFGLFKGAEDELKFRTFLRNRQIPARSWAWYSAYPNLTALNLQTNSEIRLGLIDPPEAQQQVKDAIEVNEASAQKWLRKL